VYDASTDKLLGFVDLGPTRPDSNLAASHALQFYARGVVCNFSMPIAFFATKSSQADYLASMLWEIVEAVVTCGFHVLAVIADGASCNRKLFHLLNNEKLHVPYKCINIYDPDVPLFLISDPPHLLKTACNNIRSSSVHGSKLLKYDEHFILWEHFKKVPTLFDTTELRCC